MNTPQDPGALQLTVLADKGTASNSCCKPSFQVRPQDYEVLLLVGAGIGVTPFASVLADMVNRLESRACKHCGAVDPQITSDGSGLQVQKIYFREALSPLVLWQPFSGLPSQASVCCASSGRRRCRAAAAAARECVCHAGALPAGL